MVRNSSIAPFARVARTSQQPRSPTLVERLVTGAADGAGDAMTQVLKPYMLLACVAFVFGFASYLAVGKILAAPQAASSDWQATVSTPALSQDLPLTQGKRI